MTIQQRKLSFLKKYKLVCLSYFYVSSDLDGNVQTLTCEEIFLSGCFIYAKVSSNPQSPPQPCRAACSILFPAPGIEPMPPAMRVLVLIAGPPGKFPSNSLSVSFPDHNNLEVFSNLSSEHGNMRWSLNRKTHYFLLSLVTYQKIFSNKLSVLNGTELGL